jgi:hypothetical protein
MLSIKLLLSKLSESYQKDYQKVIHLSSSAFITKQDLFFNIVMGLVIDYLSLSTSDPSFHRLHNHKPRFDHQPNSKFSGAKFWFCRNFT